ncbi:MAG: GAF domain-containing protein [Bryobacteraceae bacterium]
MATDDSRLPAACRGPLHRISAIVSSDRSLDEILTELVSVAVEGTDSDACLVYLLDQETGEVVLRASQLPHAKELGEVRLKLGEGVAGWVAAHSSVMSLPAYAWKDLRFKALAMLEEDTFEALLSAPLVAEGRVVGVINIHHREPRQHTAEELAFVEFLGQQIGGALERARLREQNARLQEEARQIKQQLETRKLVERAKGILQKRLKLSEEDAYLWLRNESRRQRRSMRELAEIIIADEMRLRGQILD